MRGLSTICGRRFHVSTINNAFPTDGAHVSRLAALCAILLNAIDFLAVYFVIKKLVG